jgi:hypothetical protein
VASSRVAFAVAAVAAVALWGAGFAAGIHAADHQSRRDQPKPEVRYLTRTVEVPTVRYWPSEPKIVTVYKEREAIPQPWTCLVTKLVR